LELEPTPIAGTFGARNPFFSPDGEWVGFLADGQLKKVALRGGSPTTLGEWPEVPQGATWTEGGTIVLGSGYHGLIGISEDGGVQEAITTLAADQGQRGHNEPYVLPGDRGVLFSVRGDSGRRVAVLSFDSDEWQTLTDGFSPRYIESGHIVFARANSLWAAPFDLDRLKLLGTAVPVLDGLQLPRGIAHYAISGPTLLYLPLASQDTRLIWVDRGGLPTAILDEPDAHRKPRLSPNGKSVVLERAADGGVGIWVHHLDRGTRVRLTPDGTYNDPLWSIDGKRIAFTLGSNLYAMAADGSGEAELLLDREHAQFPHSWSPDGRLLAFYDLHPKTSRDIWVLPMDGDREPMPIAVTSFNERSPSFSPDGRWLAYVSNESDRDEIFVRSLEREAGAQVVSIDGGTDPVWSPAGDELFYRNGNRMMVTSVQLGETFEATSPEVLFVGGYDSELPPSGSQSYDVSRDGQRFLMTELVEQPNSGRIIVVLNWGQELKRLVPTD
jgi:serine/threonine-protein kinase